MKEAITVGGNVLPLPARKGRKRRSSAPATLLQFVPKQRGPLVNHETVRQCERLLAAARGGRINGLAWVAALTSQDGYCADVAGLAATDLRWSVGCLFAHALKLADLRKEREAASK